MGKIRGSGRKPLVRTFEYDFARDGGAVSAITLTELNGEDSSKLHDNDLVLRCWSEVVTAATSGGSATVKLGYTGNDDAFVGLTAFDDASWDVAGDVASRASELPIKLAADVSVLATVAVAALTAGKILVHIETIPSA